MALEEGSLAVAVRVLNCLSGEEVCTIQLEALATVLHAKRQLQTETGVNVFCQRLLLESTEAEPDDEASLGSLLLDEGPLVLTLIRLKYADPYEEDVGARLLYAAANGPDDVMVQLLRLPVCPDHTDADEDITPLFHAAQGGRVAAVRLLCEAGAEKDRRLLDGHTPLTIAVQNRHLEVALALCEAGAATDVCMMNGISPLYLASALGQPDVVKVLLEAGANKDKETTNRCRPILIASQFGHRGVVRLLCQAGAITEGERLDGFTAVSAARERGFDKIVDLLLKSYKPWPVIALPDIQGEPLVQGEPPDIQEEPLVQGEPPV